jgi:hypothetical protein
MKSSSASFLQGVVVLIGLGVLALMLWEPHLEGRNAQATVFEIYFKDPFLAYVYAGSIPFFVGLRRAFGLLGDLKRNGTCSRATVDALRAIKRCGLAVIGFVAGAVGMILMLGDGEDRPGGIFMCLLVIVAAGSVATVAARLARRLQENLARNA